ncbi:MAG: UDP-N-acetylglucosamine 1-carboxyvinyltransferase, partial [Ardenticatenaceae bacterium]
MNRFIIEGQHPLAGTITPRGSKNGALPAVAATLLSDESVTLRRLPGIKDVKVMSELVHDLGADVVRVDEQTVRF